MDEKLIREILSKNLAEQSEGKQAELLEGLQIIPAGKMFEIIQYFVNDLLPKVEISRGKNSNDFKQMESVVHSLMYAIKLMEDNQQLRRENSRLKFWNKTLQGINDYNEIELDKYRTVEHLMYSGELENVRKAVIEKGLKWAGDAVKAFDSRHKK